MYHFSDYNNRYTTRICNKSDKTFILNVYETTIFNQVKEYYEIDLEMFNNRFDIDYYEIEIIMFNNKPIGFYQININESVITIQRLFLHPEYHRQGIGKSIMTSIIKWGKENNHQKIQLMVWENNPAFYFYKTFGFNEVEKNNHKFTMQLPINRDSA